MGQGVSDLFSIQTKRECVCLFIQKETYTKNNKANVVKCYVVNVTETMILATLIKFKLFHMFFSR